MSSFDRVIELVNEKNDPTYPLTPNTITLNDVTPDPSATHNTRVTIKAVRGVENGYTGEVDVFYTRTNLTALGPLAFWRERPYTYEEIFPLINRLKNAQMGPEDFTNGELPPIPNGEPTAFILSAQDNSLGWLGNTRVTLLSGIPETAPQFNDFWTQEVGALFAPVTP